MKNSFYVLTVIILSIITSCTEEDLCLKGSGNVENYQLTTDDFDEISLMGPVNLRIKQGPTRSLNVEAEPEIFSELEYSVRNGMLKIGFEDNVTCFETNYGVWINLTLPNIKAIYQSGISEIISDGDIFVARLELSISGTAEISLSGEVDDQIIESSGVLTARNFNLRSMNSWLNISGTADVELSCSANLELNVDGSAKIAYKGNPVISQEVSGELDLIDAN